MCVCVWSQALEEAAADAAEEEQRRLQTQTELQDRYRSDLERERLVGQKRQPCELKHFLFLVGVCVCVSEARNLLKGICS